jgi:hypothetical protein
MACPNFKNGPKNGLRLLGVNHPWLLLPSSSAKGWLHHMTLPFKTAICSFCFLFLTQTKWASIRSFIVWACPPLATAWATLYHIPGANYLSTVSSNVLYNTIPLTCRRLFCTPESRIEEEKLRALRPGVNEVFFRTRPHHRGWTENRTTITRLQLTRSHALHHSYIGSSFDTHLILSRYWCHNRIALTWYLIDTRARLLVCVSLSQL